MKHTGSYKTTSWTRALDTLIIVLLLFISALLLTGGTTLTHPKLEFSQVNIFALVLFILLGLRYKITRQWLSPQIERRTKQLLHFFEIKPLQTLSIAIVVYCILQTWISIWRFDSFHANAYDLSYIGQPLWATARGAFLHCSLCVQQTYLGEHFSPILSIVSLLCRVWNSVYMIFIIQSLILALGAALVYKLSKSKSIKTEHAVLLSLCFLIYMPLRNANQFDFREDNIFVLTFLGVFLSIESGKWLFFWMLAILSWSIKENASIFTFMVALWLLARKERRLHGIVLAILSLAIFYVVNSKLTPYFSGSTSKTRFAFRLGSYGNNTTELIRFIFLHPYLFCKQISNDFFTKDTLKYLIYILLPFFYFARFSLAVFMIALAGLAMNIIMGINHLGFHYECIVIPFLFYVLIDGVKQMRNLSTQGCVLIFISFLIFFGRSPIHELRQYLPTKHDRFVLEQLQKIPPQASIATQTVLHPHLMQRTHAALFVGQSDVDFIIADLSPGIDLYGTPRLKEDLAKINTELYEKVLDQDYLFIWKKRKSTD